MCTPQVAEALRSITFNSTGELQTVPAASDGDHIIIPPTAGVPTAGNIPMEVVTEEDGGQVIYVPMVSEQTQVVTAEDETEGATKYVQLQPL